MSQLYTVANRNDGKHDLEILSLRFVAIKKLLFECNFSV